MPAQGALFRELDVETAGSGRVQLQARALGLDQDAFAVVRGYFAGPEAFDDFHAHAGAMVDPNEIPNIGQIIIFALEIHARYAGRQQFQAIKFEVIGLAIVEGEGAAAPFYAGQEWSTALARALLSRWAKYSR